MGGKHNPGHHHSRLHDIHATEGASGIYLFGGHSLNAGISAPPGLYLTVAPFHYGGSVGGTLQGGGEVLQLHKQVDSVALLGKHGFIATARYYHEFSAKRHFEGSMALMTFILRL